MTTPTPVLFTLVACLYLVSPRYRIRLREHPRSFGLKDDKPAVLQCFLVLLEFSSALSTPPHQLTYHHHAVLRIYIVQVPLSLLTLFTLCS